jgi:hypothetical protein
VRGCARRMAGHRRGVCFSLEADVVVGLGLLPVGVLALREVRTARELPFAALPLLFAVHQLVEAVVWAGEDLLVPAGVAAAAAALAYLLVAFPLLPTLVPLAVLLLEPVGQRWRAAPFLALGVVVSVALLVAVLAEPVGVEEHRYGLEHDTGLRDGERWTAVYVLAVLGPTLLSGYRSIVAFGALNLVGLSVAAAVYRQGFTSLWCLEAALASVLVLVHMVRRRHLPDLDRLSAVRVG